MKSAVKAILIILTLSVQAYTLDCMAETAWFTAHVVLTGKVNKDTVLVRMTDTAKVPAFKNKWFRAKPAIANEVLATTLAAITSDLLVRVRTDPSQPGKPLILQLYLKAP